MEASVQELVTELEGKGFGKGIDTKDACKKLKKADLVDIIEYQQKVLGTLNKRFCDSVAFIKCLDMAAFNKAKEVFEAQKS